MKQIKQPFLIIVISQVEKSLGFEWFAESLDQSRCKVLFVLLNKGDSELEQHLLKLGFAVKRLRYSGKWDRKHCFYALLKLFLTKRPDIVHAHLVEGGLTALPAAWLARVPKRIYTRHHSTYHHLYHPAFVKVDRWMNRFATHIVAISRNVKNVLMEYEKVPESKIHLIHHGFRLSEIAHSGVSATLSSKYNPLKRAPVIGVISRYQHLKGLQFIIPAFRELLAEFPNALLVLANARGEYAVEVKKLLTGLPEESFVEINFEPDIAGLYSIFDVFIHTPVNSHCEAFGQIYIEALAAGVPSVFTLSGIAADFIVDRKNALVVPFCDSGSIHSAVKELLTDSSLRNSLIRQGKEDVFNNFDLHKMMTALVELYEC